MLISVFLERDQHGIQNMKGGKVFADCVAYDTDLEIYIRFTGTEDD